MTVPSKEKTVSPPDAQGVQGAPPHAGKAAQAGAASEKSWGDKYKEKSFHLFRNVFINYIVNFVISAILTYKVTGHKKVIAWRERWVGENGQAIKIGNKIGMHPYLTEKVFDFGTTTQLLLCGGHALVWPMKATHDHKKLLEFQMGHTLDRLQELTGHGNAASKHNIAEYKYIRDLFKEVKAKPRKLTGDEKTMLAKHCIGDNLQFNEHPESWKHVLYARGMGVSFTTGLSILFGAGTFFGRKPNAINTPLQWIDAERDIEFPGNFLGKNVYKPIFGDKLARPDKLGYYTVMEIIYTALSKLGFDKMEHRLLKKQEQKEAADAAAALEQDKKFLGHSGIRPADAADIHKLHAATSRVPSTGEARRKILDKGATDHRARELSKVGEPSLLSP